MFIKKFLIIPFIFLIIFNNLLMASSKTPKIEGIRWGLDFGRNISSTSNYTAEFNSNRLSGSTQCNSFSGSYLEKQKNLKIGYLLSTFRGCASDVQSNNETTFLNNLENVTKYEIKQQKLYLYNNQNNLLLVFNKLGINPRNINVRSVSNNKREENFSELKNQPIINNSSNKTYSNSKSDQDKLINKPSSQIKIAKISTDEKINPNTKTTKNKNKPEINKKQKNTTLKKDKDNKKITKTKSELKKNKQKSKVVKKIDSKKNIKNTAKNNKTKPELKKNKQKSNTVKKIDSKKNIKNTIKSNQTKIELKKNKQVKVIPKKIKNQMLNQHKKSSIKVKNNFYKIYA